MRFIAEYRNTRNCLTLEDYNIVSLKQLNVPKVILQLTTDKGLPLFIFCRDEAVLENVVSDFITEPYVLFDDAHRSSQIQDWIYIPNSEGLFKCIQMHVNKVNGNNNTYWGFTNTAGLNYTFQQKQNTIPYPNNIYDVEFGKLIEMRNTAEGFIEHIDDKIKAYEDKGMGCSSAYAVSDVIYDKLIMIRDEKNKILMPIEN